MPDRALERARLLRRELPGMLDLLRVSVQAGLPLTAALTAVGERSRGVLGAEWRVVGREVALGVPLADSLRSMRARAPVPEVAALIGLTLLQPFEPLLGLSPERSATNLNPCPAPVNTLRARVLLRDGHRCVRCAR